MLYATNLNSPSLTERLSAERWDYLLYATKKEKRADDKIRRENAREDARIEREEAERKSWLNTERRLLHQQT
jgi:hypothetical protein